MVPKKCLHDKTSKAGWSWQNVSAGPDKTSKPVLTKRLSRSWQNVHPDKTSADQILRHKLYILAQIGKKYYLWYQMWSPCTCEVKKERKVKSESERKVRVKKKWEWNCSGWEPWDRDWRRSVNIDKISALNPNLLHLKQKTSASIMEEEEMYFIWYALVLVAFYQQKVWHLNSVTQLKL